VVVDDGSRDDTQAVLKRYADDPRVVLIHQENAGQTVAKNRGLAACTGDYVGFCDADNAWLPDKLEAQMQVMAEASPPGVVYGDIQFIDDQGRDLPTPRVERHSGRITGRLLADNFVPFNTCLVPRRILTEVGGFDESLSMAIDYDLWLRISVRYEFRHLPRTLARYRIWGGQMSHRTGERLDNALRMMDKFVREHGDAVTPAEMRRAWAFTYTTRGRWLARQGHKTLAMEDFRKALRQSPGDSRTWKSILRLALGR
jgi:glycosyltransferase involved in cell wall biosynthesis